MTEKLNGWGRFIPIALFVLAGAIGYGVLRGDVAAIAKAVETKASRETVDVQYREILRRLDAIDRRLERMGQ